MLFRKRIIRYVDPTTGKRRDSAGNPVTSKTPGAKRLEEKSTKWYLRVRLPDGTQVERAGYSSKEATRQLEARILRDAENHTEGLGRFEEANRLPLTEHLGAFELHIQSKNNTEKHVRDTIARATAAFAGCGFGRLPELSADKLGAWLKSQRDAGMAVATSNYHLQCSKAFATWCV
ncbi:MAG: hypothetical protein IT428_16310 [Planctomycetaceae bacterium]|nr:hypothetical protein [Planctomycetaceae bacterium]